MNAATALFEAGTRQAKSLDPQDARPSSAAAPTPSNEDSAQDSTAHGSAVIRKVRHVGLRGPAGRLEALLNEGAPGAMFAALVCHPHPLGGGTMHNKVVYHAMKALNDSAWGLDVPVLRFNFRGAGLSQGVHDGRAEAGDVLAALEWLDAEFHLPVVAAGFSFGAAMVLEACWRWENKHDVRALIALGLPLEAEGRRYQYPFLKDVLIPKLFLSGDRDRFAPVAELERVAASAGDPKQLTLIQGADHFFAGHLEAMQQSLSSWLREQTS
jgi:alpha/beta superfamily hydrolase